MRESTDLLQKIQAGRRYIKKPIPVAVVFATESGMLQTLEGMVSYRPEDAIMSGVQGERWPIARARFDASYQACGPQAHGRDGLYLKKPMPVHALQADSALQVLLENGRDSIQARPGDWLLADAGGSIWVVAPDIFAQSYERLANQA